jgi:hypothetical protein
MDDNIALSSQAIDLIKSDISDGFRMIATCRAILSGHYSDADFSEEFFSIFIAIDDDTGNLILKNFGDFNSASPRFELKKSNVANFVKLLINDADNKNSFLDHEEARNIYSFYKDQFFESLNVFKDNYIK